MKKQPCRIQKLAADGPCAVEYCPDCELFHIKIGYTSLHIGHEAFLRLGVTLETALARFGRVGNGTGADRPAEPRKRDNSVH